MSPGADGPRLDGADPHERASAVVERALGQRRGAWKSIAPLAADPAPLVRGAVAFAAARLTSGADLAPLLDLLSSRGEDEVAFAVEAVGTLGDAAVPALLARAIARRTGRAALLRMLVELDSPAARAALAQAAAGDDADLARRARRALRPR